MNSETRGILRRGFPKELIKKRKGLGGTYDFVTGSSVQDRLDEAFRGSWSWDVDPAHGYKIGKEWIYVVGTLTAHPGDGNVLRKAGEGAVKIKKSQAGQILDLGFDISAASTKALKKAAARFGIAREIEVAEPNDAGSKPVADSTPRPSRPKAESNSEVFPDPGSSDRNLEDAPASTDSATPVQVDAVKTRVRDTGIHMLEAIRKALGREDGPDQPENLTREEAKKVLIFLNK